MPASMCVRKLKSATAGLLVSRISVEKNRCLINTICTQDDIQMCAQSLSDEIMPTSMRLVIYVYFFCINIWLEQSMLRYFLWFNLFQSKWIHFCTIISSTLTQNIIVGYNKDVYKHLSIES